MPQPSASVPLPLAALVLLPAAMACGLGLGALGLRWWPGAETPVAPLPPLAAAPAPPAAAPPAAPWPAAFGTRRRAPAPEPAPPPVAAAQPVPTLDARLRGLALDEDGGWALIELGGAVVFVRPGSLLDDHHTVLDILQDGVAVASPAGPLLLTFPDPDPAEPRPARPSLPRAILRGDLDPFEMLDLQMPLPPAGYVPGPGFAGPANR